MSEFYKTEQEPSLENKWQNYFESLYDLTTFSNDEISLENPASNVLPPDEESAEQAIEFLKRSLICRDIWEKDGKRGYTEYGTGFDNWVKGGIPAGTSNFSDEEKQSFQRGIFLVLKNRWIRDSRNLAQDLEQKYHNLGLEKQLCYLGLKIEKE